MGESWRQCRDDRSGEKPALRPSHRNVELECLACVIPCLDVVKEELMDCARSETGLQKPVPSINRLEFDVALPPMGRAFRLLELDPFLESGSVGFVEDNDVA